MAHSITTSIRLPESLRNQLEQTAHTLHRGKNWIMIKALEQYFSQQPNTDLAKEARRQSLLANKADRLCLEEWPDNQNDTSGWE
jgi:predicted DNA-binding protein